jgi:hypothetical protein
VAINIHRGGRKGTSSLGCQTIHPDQWQAFYAMTRSEMKKVGLARFWYVLAEGRSSEREKTRKLGASREAP